MAKPISPLSRHMISSVPSRISGNSNKASSFMPALSSSTRNLRSLLRATHSCKVGSFIPSNPLGNAAKKPALSPSRPCNYSLTCQRRTWPWGNPIITATTITMRRRKNSKSPSADCLTNRKFISLSARSSAASLNPKESWPLQNLAQNYQVLRDFDAANKTIDRGLKVDPSGLGLWETKSKLAIAEKGDFGVSEQAFQAVKSMPMNNEQKLRTAGSRADVYVLERKYQDGLREAENLPDDLLAAIPKALSGKYFLIGFARKALQDEAGARAAFLKAKDLLEAQLKESPESPDMHILLAKVLACLGETD